MPVQLSNDKYEFKGVNTVDTNPFTFFIATVVDETLEFNGLATCLVSLTTDRYATSLTIRVGQFGEFSDFSVLEDDFSEVCVAIQKKTFEDIDKFEKE